LDIKKLGTIPFDMDTETFREAMAFTGPLPEVGAREGGEVRLKDTNALEIMRYCLSGFVHVLRLSPPASARPCRSPTAMEAFCHALQRTNGRIAMIAFVGAAAAEVSTGKSIAEQASASPLFITFMVLLLSVAGFVPKLASGVSLSRLIDAAGMLCRNVAAGADLFCSQRFRHECVNILACLTGHIRAHLAHL
jgi:hypothetical protein